MLHISTPIHSELASGTVGDKSLPQLPRVHGGMSGQQQQERLDQPRTGTLVGLEVLSPASRSAK